MDQVLYIKKRVSDVLGLEITEIQAQQLAEYYRLLIEKNKVMNLTRITEFEEVVDKHFVDSLSLIRALDPVKAGIRRVLDLGSGSGMPGIPLKIVWPSLDVLMIDSVGKKMNFVNEVIAALGLTGVQGLHARAEELARKSEYREGFDLCTSRAVANLATLSEYCLPFVRVGGLFVAYKSGESAEEIKAGEKAVKVMGGSVPQILDFELCGFGRTLVVSEKKKHTGKEYPRKSGMPSKSPII